MIELLHNLAALLGEFAENEWEWVIVVLFAVSFTESIISPFPPDPILVAAAIFNPDMTLIFASVVTVASVAGALMGHWIGKRFGRPILRKFVSAKNVERVEELFRNYGAWAIVFAAVTPVPYKVFAITAGAIDMDRKPFILASLVGRGARMFIWAGLVIVFGKDALALLETRGLILGVGFGVAVIAAFALYLLIAHLRRRAAKST